MVSSSSHIPTRLSLLSLLLLLSGAHAHNGVEHGGAGKPLGADKDWWCSSPMSAWVHAGVAFGGAVLLTLSMWAGYQQARTQRWMPRWVTWRGVHVVAQLVGAVLVRALPTNANVKTSKHLNTHTHIYVQVMGATAHVYMSADASRHWLPGHNTQGMVFLVLLTAQLLVGLALALLRCFGACKFTCLPNTKSNRLDLSGTQVSRARGWRGVCRPGSIKCWRLRRSCLRGCCVLQGRRCGPRIARCPLARP